MSGKYFLLTEAFTFPHPDTKQSLPNRSHLTGQFYEVSTHLPQQIHNTIYYYMFNTWIFFKH